VVAELKKHLRFGARLDAFRDVLGDQVAQLCAHGEQSAYWSGQAANTSRIVARSMDAVRAYLVACGGQGNTPPTTLAALELGRGHKPLPPMYAPFGWSPRLSVLDLYGVTSIHRLLGWMLRIVFADRLDLEPDAPEFSDKATTIRWWDAYLADRTHPDDAHPERGALITAIRRHMQRLRDLMDREADELGRGVGHAAGAEMGCGGGGRDEIAGGQRWQPELPVGGEREGVGPGPPGG